MSRSKTLNTIKTLAKGSVELTGAEERRQVYRELAELLDNFEAMLSRDHCSDDLFDAFVRMGVERFDDPNNAFRKAWPNTILFSRLMQQLYNLAAWELLEDYGALPGVHWACLKDVGTPDRFMLDEVMPFGQIVRKDYGRELLDHFLVPTPDPEWIGT